MSSLAVKDSAEGATPSVGMPRRKTSGEVAELWTHCM